MVRKRKRQVHLLEEETVPLRRIRERLDMTQAEMAHAIGLDVSTISRCERGLAEPSLTVLQMKRLCKLAGECLEEMPDYLSKTSIASIRK